MNPNIAPCSQSQTTIKTGMGISIQRAESPARQPNKSVATNAVSNKVNNSGRSM